MCKSVWSDKTQIQKHDTLHGDVKTNVFIIGGGLCGILCAYFLKNQGVDYILAEGGTVGNGITKNTTAKITSQHGLIYDNIIKTSGKETAEKYYKANEQALSEYYRLSETIDCDFEEKAAYTYSISDRDKIEREIRAVNSIGGNAEFTEHPNLPFKTCGAVKFKNQAQFNPLKFIKKISENLNIYENTFIYDIQNNYAFCKNGKIKADKIIIATHFPFINKHGMYFLKMYQHRSYVIAYKNAPDLGGMYVDESKTGMSFRNYKDLLFVGGGSHRTGKTGGNWNEIRKFTEKYYPSAEEKYFWSTQDCMSVDGIPYIGQYSKNTPNLYVASGFNKWGITSSMAAANILSDMITDKYNEYSSAFNPSRSIAKPQLFKNISETAVNFLTPSVKRCPHLGCALKWNESEHSWDCPCHGSRFLENGTLIDNPAKRNANVK